MWEYWTWEGIFIFKQWKIFEHALIEMVTEQDFLEIWERDYKRWDKISPEIKDARFQGTRKPIA